MKTVVAILIIAGIFCFILYEKFIKKNTEKKNIEDKSETDNDFQDFEKEFFERTQAGEKSQLLASLAAQQDCAVIRSLLQADNIPSYIEGEHMNNVYGGITGTMTSVVAIKLYVLCSDYEKAYEIIKNYKMDSSGITIFDKVVGDDEAEKSE